MGSPTIEAPEARNYGQETRDTLQAQVDLAPDLYRAESTYRPQYAQLDLDILKKSTPQLLKLYEDEVFPALTRAEGASRDARIAGELGAVQQYAPQMTQALREASGNAPLVDEMNRQALEGLKAGTSLDPDIQRTVSQSVRAAQASRGLGFGQSDAIAEAFASGERGLALRDNRRAFAGQMTGINQMTGGDPLMAILGRPSQTIGMAQGFGAQGQSLNPGSMFNPESNYAADVFNTNYNAKAAANIATGNAKAAITGAAIGAAGSAASAL